MDAIDGFCMEGLAHQFFYKSSSLNNLNSYVFVNKLRSFEKKM